jgi:hypothetical protein
VAVDTSLLAKFPLIAKQWHAGRNMPITPNDVTPASHRIFWWRCFKFADHIWQASVKNMVTARVKREHTGCPYCPKKKTNSKKRQSAMATETN